MLLLSSSIPFFFTSLIRWLVMINEETNENDSEKEISYIT